MVTVVPAGLQADRLDADPATDASRAIAAGSSSPVFCRRRAERFAQAIIADVDAVRVSRQLVRVDGELAARDRPGERGEDALAERVPAMRVRRSMAAVTTAWSSVGPR